MTFKKLLAATAVVAGLAVSSAANATLTNWYLDTDGAGGSPEVLVHDYIDLTGQAYVHNTFNSPTTFTFNESGIFSALSVDGPVGIGTLLSPSLSAQFTGTGNGTVGGNLGFLTGTLNVFSGATQIASFNLLTGSAALNAGTVLPNGAVSLIFQATSLATGYFFYAGHNDLATILLTNPLEFGFATTNVIPLAGNVAAPLVSLYNTAFDPDVGPVVTANNQTELYLSNNGQFRLQVPEPGSLALLGIALVGLAARRRKAA